MIAKSLKEQQEREAKEKVDAEALEAALKLSKEEATITVNSEDLDDTIQKILKTPINEDFLKSSAPSSSSVHPPQTHVLKDGIVESASDEETIDSPPPPPRALTPPPSTSTSMVISKVGSSADGE